MIQVICWVLRSEDAGDGCQGRKRPLMIEYWRFILKNNQWYMPMWHTEEPQIIDRVWEY